MIFPGAAEKINTGGMVSNQLYPLKVVHAAKALFRLFAPKVSPFTSSVVVMEYQHTHVLLHHLCMPPEHFQPVLFDVVSGARGL